GKIAMKISGFWELTDTYAQYGRDVNWAVAPPPMPAAEVAKGRTTLSWNGGWCYAIPSTAKNKTGAWELIKFLSSKRANEILCESQKLTTESQGRVFVPTQNSSRVINEWLFDKYILHNPRIDPKVAAGVKVFNDLLPDARFRPVTPVGQLLWNQHIEATDNATYHKLSAQESLDRSTMIVQRELDKVLAPARGRPLGWTFFFWSYGVLLVVVIVIVYAWDTNVKFRAILRRLVPFGRASLPASQTPSGSAGASPSPVAEVAAIEGVHSSYFRSQWRGGWLCASPWIIGFIVFTGGPILFSIIISFCDYDILNPARLIGFENYTWMFTKDPLFWKSLQNTIFMIIGVPLGMIASLGIAMLLCLKIRGVAVWRTFFYLPAIVPAVASSILWIWIFNPKAGLLNSLLASVGIAGPNWLQSEHTSKWSLILMGLWGAGGGMIIWIAGLKGISESYYEAASLDGANKWQQFRHVTIPLLSPYIFFNGIMGLIGTFQIFTQAFIMTQGGPVNSTMFYAYHLFNNAFRYLQMGYAAAMAWFLFLIVFGLTMIQMRVSERWVHYEEG
ncbi:MAG: extracellular solute-binding protein, partial [Verrucomicrobiota bacterium]